MMKDQLITLQTAKLIPYPKQDITWNECAWFYIDTFHKDGYWMGTRNDLDIDYPRPTQSLLQRWLREVHKKIVLVKFCCNGDDYDDVIYWVDVSEFEHFKTHDSFVSKEFNTYEEALENGLFEALKLIKL